MDKVQIDIIDTQTNTLVLQDERTEVNSPRLIYNGADDRFQTIMTSELHFNLLVPDAVDGKFLHLFTGDETRYKVTITDISTPLTPVLVWQGHLLPEQFSEPYESGCFFVEFVATDGVGRLKGKYLQDSFYADSQPITAIFAECLNLTGNELELFIAPAIKNAVESLKMGDLAINTSFYKEKKKKKDAYFILNALLKSLGLKLMQTNGAWYFVGINRFKDTNIVFEKYTNLGVYQTGITYNRNVSTAIFTPSVQVTAIPKLKSVEIDWQRKERDSLLPTTVIDQDFNIDNSIVDIVDWAITGENKPANYNQVQTTTNEANEHFFLALSGSGTYGNDKQLYVGLPESIGQYMESAVNNHLTVDVFNLSVIGWVTSNANKYIELIKPVYVLGDITGTKTIHFKLAFTAFVTTIVADIANVRPYKYELLLNGNVISTDEITYRFGDAQGIITAVVESKKLPISENGYLTIRFYAPMPTQHTTYLKSKKVVFETLFIKSNIDYNNVIKTRDVAFTTEKKVPILHCGVATDNTDSAILIADTYVFGGVTINHPVVEYQINTLAYTHNVTTVTGGYTFTITQWELSKEDYEALKIMDKAFIKIKRAGSYITINFDFAFTTTASNVYPIKYYLTFFAFGSVSAPFLATDELWIYKAAFTETLTDKRYLRDKWARFETTENLKYEEVLARIYHDALKENSVVINGSLFGIKLPLNMLNFNFIALRNLMLTKLTINFADGMTNVTLVEQNQENVTDYVD